jgi:hypothetical protein
MGDEYTLVDPGTNARTRSNTCYSPEAMKSFYNFLWEARHIVAAVVLVGGWIFNQKYGPGQDDLPLGLKSLLVISFIVPFYLVLQLPLQQHPRSMIILAVVCLMSTVLYMIIRMTFGYTKIVAKPPRSWPIFWRKEVKYEQQRIVGGRLRQDTKEAMKQHKVNNVQEYFAGVLYEQDRVWTRGSLALMRTALVLVYFIVTMSFVGILAIAFESDLRTLAGSNV